MCEFGFAVGRKWKAADGEQREESTFIDCVLFGKGAEVFNQYMVKGKQAYLEGRLTLEQWDDKTTGQKRSKLKVTVEDFQFLGAPSDGQRREESGGQRADGYGAKRSPAHRSASDEQEFKEDDLPF